MAACLEPVQGAYRRSGKNEMQTDNRFLDGMARFFTNATGATFNDATVAQ